MFHCKQHKVFNVLFRSETSIFKIPKYVQNQKDLNLKLVVVVVTVVMLILCCWDAILVPKKTLLCFCWSAGFCAGVVFCFDPPKKGLHVVVLVTWECCCWNWLLLCFVTCTYPKKNLIFFHMAQNKLPSSINVAVGLVDQTLGLLFSCQQCYTCIVPCSIPLHTQSVPPTDSLFLNLGLWINIEVNQQPIVYPHLDSLVKYRPLLP